MIWQPSSWCAIGHTTTFFIHDGWGHIDAMNPEPAPQRHGKVDITHQVLQDVSANIWLSGILDFKELWNREEAPN